MIVLKIVWLVLNLAMFAAWVICVVDWVRHGAKFPRWIHFMAMGSVLLGVAAIVVSYYTHAFSLLLVLTCLLLPLVVTYGGWLWMFGPWLRQTK